MAQKKFLVSLTLFIGVVLTLSCDAPRNNPLDPENPDNVLSLLSGYVQTITIPHIPISGARVLWQNEGVVRTSRSDGFFQMENIKKEDGWIYIEKEGFSTDSIFLKWENNKEVLVESFLNSIPKIDSLMFFSSVENKYPSKQRFSIEIKVRVSDSENDVDTVLIKNDDLGVEEKLEYNPESKFFEEIFSPVDLNVTSIDEVIGKDFLIIVQDASERNFNVGRSTIKRIIKEEIIFDQPANNISVSVPFSIKWRRFDPGFDFYFVIQIYTNEVQPELVWERIADSEEISFLVESDLAPREYFWVIWCYDEFFNRGRSKPATFQIL